jgi:hypothetical protein
MRTVLGALLGSAIVLWTGMASAQSTTTVASSSPALAGVPALRAAPVEPAPAQALSTTPALPADWRPAPDLWTHAEGYRVLALTITPAGAGCRGGATFVHARYVVDRGFNPHVYGAATAADRGIVCSGGVWYHGAGPLKGKVGGTLPDLLIKGGGYYFKRG